MSKRHLVQLHMHTSESSACGRSTGVDMAREARNLGYELIVITDHFMNANTTADRSAPWPEQVDCLMAGYNQAKAEGDRIGLKVLFAWETNTHGPEYLTYGLGREFLLANPGIDVAGADEYVERVLEAGGFISHAHPYRMAWYIKHFVPRSDGIEAFEVLNASQSDAYNWVAMWDAHRRGVIQLAGSDAHHVSELSTGAMELPYEVNNMAGLIQAMRSGGCRIVDDIVPARERCHAYS